MLKIKVIESDNDRLTDQEFVLVEVCSKVWECEKSKIRIQDPNDELRRIMNGNVMDQLNRIFQVHLFEALEHGCTYIQQIEVQE